MWNINTHLNQRIIRDASNLQYSFEFRPKKFLQYPDEVQLDINLQSDVASNAVHKSDQEERSAINATRFAKGNSTCFATEFTDGCLVLGAGVKIVNTDIAVAFSMELEFNSTTLNSENPLFSICRDALASDQRMFVIGVTNTDKAYVYINGTKYESGVLANIGRTATWQVLGFSYSHVAGDTTFSFTLNGVEFYSHTITGTTHFSTTYGAGFSTYIGGSKNDTTITKYTGLIGRVILLSGYSLSEASHALNYYAISEPIKQTVAFKDLPPLINEIDPVSRIAQTNELTFVLANDGFAKQLGETYKIPAIELAIFLEHPDLDSSLGQIIFNGQLLTIKENKTTYEFTAIEFPVPLDAEKQFVTIYSGHPGELVKELFINYKYPRHSFSETELAFDHNENYSHYFLNRRIAKIPYDSGKEQVRGGHRYPNPLTGMLWQFGKTQSPTSVATLLDSLQTSCHCSLIKNQQRQFKLEFYDPSKTAVATLTENDIIEITPMPLYSNAINQLEVTFPGTEDINSGRKETDQGSLLVQNLTAQKLFSFNQYFPQVKNFSISDVWMNTSGLLVDNPGGFDGPILIMGNGCGLGLSEAQRVVGGTREAARLVDVDHPLYLAVWYEEKIEPDPFSPPQDQETKWSVEVIKITELQHVATEDPTYPPEWTIATATKRRKLNDNNEKEVVTEYWPSGYHIGVISERGVFDTTEITNLQALWYTDITPLANAINHISTRFAYGAPMFEVKLPLTFVGLELLDIVKLETSRGLLNQAELTTSANFEIVKYQLNKSNVQLTLCYRDSD